MCCDEKKKYTTPVVRQITREEIHEKILAALKRRQEKYNQLDAAVHTWDKEEKDADLDAGASSRDVS